jgi:hypothetical protein
MEAKSRSLLYQLSRYYSPNQFSSLSTDKSALLKRCKSQVFEEVCPLISQLSERIPSAQFHRYHFLFSRVLQQICSAVIILIYLEDERMASLSQVEEVLRLSELEKGKFHIPVEDYLHGVLFLGTELVRGLTLYLMVIAFSHEWR